MDELREAMRSQGSHTPVYDSRGKDRGTASSSIGAVGYKMDLAFFNVSISSMSSSCNVGT